MMENTQTGFSSDGRRFNLDDPTLLRSADADLWNDRMYLQIDHRGKVIRNGYLMPDMKHYSQPLRCFYLRDVESGELWTVPQGPIRTKADTFLFSAGKSDLMWKLSLYDIECTVRVTIPATDLVEVWSVEVKNLSSTSRTLALYSYLPFGKLSWMRQSAEYDPEHQGVIVTHFPYYVEHEDYPKLKEGWNQAFVLSDRAPDSCMCSIPDFIGSGSMAQPDALIHQRALRAPHPWADADVEQAAIMHYDMVLEADEGAAFQFVFGPAMTEEDIQKAKAYVVPGGFEKALADAESRDEAFAPALEIESPDRDFNAYMNHWQSRRSLMLVRAMRFMSAPQGRNLLQDAMAGALIDPEFSRKRFLQFYGFQHQDGWIPHGMPLEPEATQIKINTIPHKDINSWGPSALTYYIYETGDAAILDEEIPFADDPDQQASLFEHICRGLNWLLRDRTERGLCRIGQGDWNDPLNMAGYKEKGESVWLSEALAVALDHWAPICEDRGLDGLATTYQQMADDLRSKINALAWDGKWYVRGFTDEGKPFGSHQDEEGRIFLNAQSWALMAKVADEERSTSCIQAVTDLLDTPSGPMTLAPAFTRMRPDIGKLTQKIPGRLENGSVYCHAVTFYAYALYQAQRPEAAFALLRNLISGAENNPMERTGQLPLYIPNSYFGLPCDYNAGMSTKSSCSGTAAWFYRTVLDYTFGLRAEAEGLRVDPQLPQAWGDAKAVRRWRGSTYQVSYVRDEGVKTLQVILDGTLLERNLIFPDSRPRTHELLIKIPAN
ncbi:hypothetical protein P3T73_09295 [Kiritimatiellota bacterium B12222]|nr:hypothetical protein P3T73_09295 [Kiritimatiellota bacterium B12222]